MDEKETNTFKNIILNNHNNFGFHGWQIFNQKE